MKSLVNFLHFPPQSPAEKACAGQKRSFCTKLKLCILDANLSINLVSKKVRNILSKTTTLLLRMACFLWAKTVSKGMKIALKFTGVR